MPARAESATDSISNSPEAGRTLRRECEAVSQHETAQRAHANQFGNQFDTEETYPSGEDCAGSERPKNREDLPG